jgi:tRNA(adenine34) deaminase
MQRAFVLAEQAAMQGEVPVGAVIVLDGKIIGEGYNSPITLQDPSAHAEIIALRQAAATLGNYRLLHATLYVTLEPCIMCTGAMVHARIQRLIYGAADAKAGAIVSRAKTLDHTFLNHRVEYAGGLLAEQCGLLLSDFFRAKRSK